jgi:hypothetical protein
MASYDAHCGRSEHELQLLLERGRLRREAEREQVDRASAADLWGGAPRLAA